MKLLKKLLLAVFCCTLVFCTAAACDDDDSSSSSSSSSSISSSISSSESSSEESSSESSSSSEESSSSVLELSSIVASANSLTVTSGGMALLNAQLLPEGVAASVTWEIADESKNLAVVSGNLLIINASAKTGDQIKVKAVSGSVESNELVFTVGIPITEITISALGDTTVVKGNTLTFSATVNAGANASEVTWEVIEGNDLASFTDNTLVVKSDATTGATIKVVAKCGTVTSEPITVTVGATQEEINASKFFISLSRDEIKVDKNALSAPTLTAEVFNFNFESVTDQDLVYSVVEGEEYLSITQDGYKCKFTALGHGHAVVEARINNTQVVAQAEIEVIVPPEAIKVPAVFTERPNIAYNFSMVKQDNSTDTLKFVPTILGENVCQDYKVEFFHEDGTTGTDVGVYNNEVIEFRKEGKVTVKVTSVSGSYAESSTSYTFNINKGINVYNYNELEKTIESPSYQGQIVNIVVLEKPVGYTASGEPYGYDLVSDMAKLDHAYIKEQIKNNENPTIIRDLLNSSRIQAVNKNLYLNGNGHKIDLSQLYVPTMAEFDKYYTANKTEDKDRNYSIPTAFSIEPYNDNRYNGEDINDDYNVYGTYSAKIYDLEIIGNCPVDFGANGSANDEHTVGKKVTGAMLVGLSVGGISYSANYTVDMKNVTVSGFKDGFRFERVIGGVVENAHAYNIYATGITTRACIMAFNNLKFGLCGACGLEAVPDNCKNAGPSPSVDSENKNNIGGGLNQQITLQGTIDALGNLNDGKTVYLQNYTINIGGQPYTVPQILTMILGSYDQNQLSHILNANKQFVFVAFLFHNLSTGEPNTTVVSYPQWQEGGIIDAGDLPTSGFDTTHQYIRLPVAITGVADAGYAYIYNQHYQANN